MKIERWIFFWKYFWRLKIWKFKFLKNFKNGKPSVGFGLVHVCDVTSFTESSKGSAWFCRTDFDFLFSYRENQWNVSFLNVTHNITSVHTTHIDDIRSHISCFTLILPICRTQKSLSMTKPTLMLYTAWFPLINYTVLCDRLLY